MGFSDLGRSPVPETEGFQRIENRICALPDDLLLEILVLIPTKEAFATTILSKRWRYVSTMLPKLKFKDEGSQSVGWFTEKLQLHNALNLDRLTVELGPNCPVDVDVRKWVEKAVNLRVLVLDFNLLWTAEPTSFPKCLYTCDTLVFLTLSNKILVDVSSEAHLPSLVHLNLFNVVYKDEDSLVRLLSSSLILADLIVQRHEDDNLKNFPVKVSSLESFFYVNKWRNEDDDDDYLTGSLVLDSPALTDLDIMDVFQDYCLIENMPCLDEVIIGFVLNPDDKFLRSISSAIHLLLCLNKPMVDQCCGTITFSRLAEFYFCPEKSVDWLEPLTFLLQNSPKLKTLTISTEPGCLQTSWNQPNSSPGCLSHLELFGWRDYQGREDEKQLVTYILANSKCLKTVEISLLATCDLEERQKELQSMPRISTTSRLLLSTQRKWSFNGTFLS